MLIFDGSGEQETLREYCELSEKYAGVQYDNVLAYLAKKEELDRMDRLESRKAIVATVSKSKRGM